MSSVEQEEGKSDFDMSFRNEALHADLPKPLERVRPQLQILFKTEFVRKGDKKKVKVP